MAAVLDNIELVTVAEVTEDDTSGVGFSKLSLIFWWLFEYPLGGYKFMQVVTCKLLFIELNRLQYIELCS